MSELTVGVLKIFFLVVQGLITSLGFVITALFLLGIVICFVPIGLILLAVLLELIEDIKGRRK